MENLHEIENAELSNNDSSMSNEDQNVIELCNESVSRSDDDHAILPIPCENDNHLPNNINASKSRVDSLKRHLMAKYDVEIKKMIDKRHAERLSSSDETNMYDRCGDIRVANKFETKEVIEGTKSLLSKDGFKLAKFVINDEELMNPIPENDRTKGVKMDKCQEEPSSDDPEDRTFVCAHVVETGEIKPEIKPEHAQDQMLEQHSDWFRIKRTIAWFIRIKTMFKLHFKIRMILNWFHMIAHLGAAWKLNRVMMNNWKSFYSVLNGRKPNVKKRDGCNANI